MFCSWGIHFFLQFKLLHQLRKLQRHDKVDCIFGYIFWILDYLDLLVNLANN